MRTRIRATTGPSGLIRTVLPALSFASCTELPPEDPCPACEIRLQHVATLGEGSGAGELWSFPAAIARDGRGRYYVTQPTSHLGEGLAHVYDARGRFLRELGSSGEGPGQYGSVERILVAPGDTLYLFDLENRRLTVLGPELSVLETVPFEEVGFHDLVRTRAGAFVLAVGSGQPGTHTFARWDGAGRVGPFFGPVAGETPPEDRWARWRESAKQSRALAAAREGGVWSVPREVEPLLEHWTEEGELDRAVPLEAEWYTPRGDRPAGLAVPQSWVTGLWEDPHGRVWIVALTPTPGWETARSRIRNVYAADENHALLYDAVLQAIDPADGSLLATRRLSHVPSPIAVVRPGMIATPRKTQQGNWVVDVWWVG